MKTSTLLILSTIVTTVITYFLPVSRYWETFGWATAIALAILSWQQDRVYALNKETLERILALNTRLLRQAPQDLRDLEQLRCDLALAEAGLTKFGVHMADLKHGERLRPSSPSSPSLSPRS